MKSIGGKIIVSILIILFLLLVGICYILSYLITYLGSILLLILLLWMIFKSLTKLLVFPGSYKLWLRMIECNFSKELSTQASTKLSHLIIFLQSFKHHQAELPFSESTVRLFPKLITTLINNFVQIELEDTITNDQRLLLRLLQDLRAQLSTIKVKSLDNNFLTIWEVIENPEFDSYIGEGSEIDSCVKSLNDIIRLINDKADRSMLRGGYLLGTENYMRVDLMRRFRCEQFWITGSEGAKIDCLWINGLVSDENSPVIVFCNPNAAYYEFAYFQTDWIELYVGAGVNLVMWNYRGYGRSTGNPDLKSMKIDGELLIEYIRTHKKSKIIGIHGESLGGSIASHLAKVTKIDFLFADRTFASLANAAKFNYGQLAELVFKVVGPKDSNAVKDFIEVECFKIISCDCNDIMINNLGSLKAGVACEYFSQYNIEGYPFNDSQISVITKSICEIQTVGKFKKTPLKEKKKNRKGYLESGNPAMNLVFSFEEIIENIDAGGEKLIDLFINCSEYRVKIWTSVLGIWGSTPSIYSSDHYNNFQSAFDKFEAGIKELNIVINEFQSSSNPEVKNLLYHFEVIREFLLNLKDWVANSNPKENITGKLLPLSCGHSGSFNSLERYLYEQYLQSAGFI